MAKDVTVSAIFFLLHRPELTPQTSTEIFLLTSAEKTQSKAYQSEEQRLTFYRIMNQDISRRKILQTLRSSSSSC